MIKQVGQYSLDSLVGSGSFGKVYHAVNEINHREYAIKSIQVAQLKDPILQHLVDNEIKIFKRLQKCQYIVKFYQMMKTHNHLYLIYQYCNGGTLQSMIKKNKTLKEIVALQIFKQLLCAFEVLEKNYIVHRDVKPENILISNGRVKLADFGFCKNLGKNKMAKTMIGSPIYMAPEILKENQYCSKADIWSLGIVLFQMLYGFCPYQSSSIVKLMVMIQSTQLQFPKQPQVSNKTKQLLKKMLTKNPKKRISWKELFEVPLTKGGTYTQVSSVNLRSRKLSEFYNDICSYSRRSQSTDTCREKQLLMFNISNPEQKIVSSAYKTSRDRKSNNTPHCKKDQNNQTTDDQHLKVQNSSRKRILSSINTTDTKRQKEQPTIIKNYIQVKQQFLHQKYKFDKINELHKIVIGLQICKKFLSTPARHSTLFSIIVYKVIIKRLEKFQVSIRQNEIVEDIHQNVILQLQQIKEQKQKLENANAFFLSMVNQYEQNQRQFLMEKIPQCKNWKLCYDMLCYFKKIQHTESSHIESQLLQKKIKDMLEHL